MLLWLIFILYDCQLFYSISVLSLWRIKIDIVPSGLLWFYWLLLVNVSLRRSLIGHAPTCQEANWLTWLQLFPTCPVADFSSRSFASKNRAAAGPGGERGEHGLTPEDGSFCLFVCLFVCSFARTAVRLNFISLSGELSGNHSAGKVCFCFIRVYGGVASYSEKSCWVISKLIGACLSMFKLLCVFAAKNKLWALVIRGFYFIVFL